MLFPSGDITEPDMVSEPVIIVLLLMETIVPVSVMLLSFKCSIPVPFGMRFVVRYVSFPRLLYVSGPSMK